MSAIDQYLHEDGRSGIFTRLARLGLLVEEFQRSCLEGFSITFIEFSTLRVISIEEAESPITATELARYIFRSTGGVTQIVDRLVEKGLVLRQADPADRRRVRIELTKEGRVLTDSAQAIYARRRSELTAELADGEIASIDDALWKLLAVLGDESLIPDRRRQVSSAENDAGR